MRITGPKCRICRRLGEKLFLKGDKCMSADKCPIAQGASTPGLPTIKHPKGKPSEYKKQLCERQKIRKSYGITERALYNLYQKAINKEGRTGDIILQLLECRLDNIVYRTGFVSGRTEARHLTSHGHFLVNGRRVDIPSYQVKINDIIGIREGSKTKKVFEGAKLDVSVRWLKADPKKNEIIVAALPEKDDFSDNFNIQAVVESYSR